MIQISDPLSLWHTLEENICDKDQTKAMVRNKYLEILRKNSKNCK